ncbi:MAG TPA: TIGR01777 family oxidoreductase [Candidatus Acidoferrales bacterium]|nr:TIGR01777 family oxidoreductase [Candidatus Acidoferrales bacterium]
MRILISGASGLVGTAVASALRADGHEVIRFVRPRGTCSPGDVRWDPAAEFVDAEGMEGAEAIVHLAGAGIGDSRWSETRKKTLRESRVNSTRTLVEAVARLRRKPRILLAASAVGYYGDRGDDVLNESSSNGEGFLAALARDWELESLRAQSIGLRVVLLRFGMILSAEGGVLPRMTTPFKLGLGGRLGNGRQWVAWIALEDAIGVIRAALVDDALSGPVNVVSPAPVRNAEFTQALAGALHRPAIFSIPVFALRLAFGEMAMELLLASQRVEPAALIEKRYAFRLPGLEDALRSMLTTEE